MRKDVTRRSSTHKYPYTCTCARKKYLVEPSNWTVILILMDKMIWLIVCECECECECFIKLCVARSAFMSQISITDWKPFTYIEFYIIPFVAIYMARFSWVIDQIFHISCVTIYLAAVKLNLIKAFRNWFLLVCVCTECYMHFASILKQRWPTDRPIKNRFITKN